MRYFLLKESADYPFIGMREETQTLPLRNPGPPGGYLFLRYLHKVLPRVWARRLIDVGTWVALLGMPMQRAYSIVYLEARLGRACGLRDAFKHFQAFVDYLLTKLLIADGVCPRFQWAENTPQEIVDFMGSSQQALLGSFHVGYSDLIGFKLAEVGRKVSMVRLRVKNSADVDALLKSAGDSVSILWANKPEEMIFRMKDALDAGLSLALQCDRIDNASKKETFFFLGAERLFPTTIYRLASLYRLPVLFCFAFPDEHEADLIRVYPSSLWHPDSEVTAREHFTQVLQGLESLLAKNPWMWFNFK